MSQFHELSLSTGPAGLVFACVDGCSRRMVVERRTGVLTIIDRGDPYAQHRGSHSDLSMSAPSVTGAGAHEGPAAR
ncbi:MAG: hypothetical protein QOG07_1875 [Pseudonocardiales bacterium]|jgi:hypothetical protein|nr:hypothetical protein [Pseudonocardiales bacterium]MDT4985411.1 hypothetical protein [Pseudonocardiales bacterium]